MQFPLTTTALYLYLSFFPTATATQCDRTFLNDMSALYTDAQAKGLPSTIPSINSTSLIYTEQFQPKPLNASILTKPLNITSTRRFIDAALCTSFTQLIVTSAAHPYVIGTRMEGDGLYVTKMETLVTDAGDWAFNATGYAYYDGREDWGVIPEAERDSRAVIQAAGDKYFDRFADLNVSVPWGEECARLEGGAYTDPRGEGGNTCDLGLPGSIKVVDRRYVFFYFLSLLS